MTIDHAARGHAKLSPSNAFRWMTCPASTKYSDPPGSSTDDADLGTKIHEMGEARLKAILAGKPVPEVPMTITCGKKTLGCVPGLVETYANACLATIEDYLESQFGTEARVKLFYGPGTGTTDWWCLNGTELTILDYKNGTTYVEEDCPQVKIYALCKLRELIDVEIKTVKTTIVQPRCFVGDPIRTATHDINDIVLFGSEVQKAANHIRDTPPEELKYVPGAGCKWCPHAKECKAKNDAENEAAMVAFDGFDGTELLPDLTEDDRAEMAYKIWSNAAHIKAAISAAAAYLAKNGHPMVKVIAGKAGTRSWPTDKAGVKYMKGLGISAKERFVKKMLSPAAVEKNFGVKVPKEITVQIAGKPRLAPISSKQPALLDYDPTAFLEAIAEDDE